jgi:hypothetical protein
MSVLVAEQDETVQTIETTAAHVEKDTETGSVLYTVALLLYSRFFCQTPTHRRCCYMGARSTEKENDLPSHSIDHYYHYCYRPRRPLWQITSLEKTFISGLLPLRYVASEEKAGEEVSSLSNLG